MAVTAPSATSAVTKAPTRRRRSRRVEPVYYAYLFPMLLVFTVAIPVATIMGIVLSFTNSVGFGQYEFTGLNNYIAAVTDPNIRAAYGFTLGFSFVTVILVNVVAFLLAIGLTARIRAKVFLRTAYVLPMVVSGIVIAFVFNFLFSNSVPAVAAAIGIGPLKTSILANPDLAWIGVVIVTAWQSIPSALLIYIAGVMSIPGTVYEAAGIDGASPARQLWSITVPLTAGYIVINVVIGFKNFLNAYDIIVGLTGGGPGTATQSVAMSIFNGFTNGDYAYQMANATIFFIITVIVALLQLAVTRGKGVFG